MNRRKTVIKAVSRNVFFCALQCGNTAVKSGNLQIPASTQHQKADYAASAAKIADAAAGFRRGKGAKQHGVRTQGKCAFGGKRIKADLFHTRGRSPPV